MSSSIDKQLSSKDIRFRSQWILSTTLCSAFGMGVSIFVTLYTRDKFDIFLAIILSGAFTGVPQWLILRKYLQKASQWIFATVLGWVSGLIIPTGILLISIWIIDTYIYVEGALNMFGGELGVFALLLTSLVGGILGASVGVMLGLAQSIVLNRHGYRASHWILVTTGSWATALAIGLVTITVLIIFTFNSLAQASEEIIIISICAFFVIAGAIIGVIVGAFTATALENLIRTDQSAKSQPFLHLIFNSWTELNPLQKMSSLIGIIGLIVSLGFSTNLILGEFRARLLDYMELRLSPVPCDPNMTIEADKRIITENESVVININLFYPSKNQCEVDVYLFTPNFDISPQEESQTAVFTDTARVVWVLSPRKFGTYQIAVGAGAHHGSIGITVTNGIGMSAYQVQWFTYIGAFLGSAFSLPWLYTIWQERKKEKLSQKRDEELEKLKRQVNEMKHPKKGKK